MNEVLVLGFDEVPGTRSTDGKVVSLAIVAECDGMRYYLTHCCSASSKGMSEGVGCRACYKLIPDYYGGLPAQSGPIKYPLGDGVEHSVFASDREHYMDLAFSIRALVQS